MADETVKIIIAGEDRLSAPARQASTALSGLQKNVSQSSTGLNGLQKSAGLATTSLGTIDGASKQASAGLGGLINTLSKVGFAAMGLQMVAQAAQGLGNALGVGLLMELEDTRAQFMAFYKDAGKVEDVLAQIRVEANKTPFTFSEISRAAANLGPAAKQAGVGLMDLIQMSEILAASNPQQGLEGAAFALREAVSGDFTSIIERFNLPRSAINKLKAEGVPALEAINRVMLEMGYDMSLVTNKSKTLAGRWSTFQDAVDTLKMTIAKPIFDALGEGLDWISGLMNDNNDAIQSFAKGIAGGFSTAIGWVKKLGTGFGDILGYLGAGNKRDLMREWFGNLGPSIDKVVRVVKKGVEVITDSFSALFSGNWWEPARAIGEFFEETFGAQGVGKWLLDTGRAVEAGIETIGLSLREGRSWPEAIFGAIKAAFVGINWNALWTGIQIGAETVGRWFTGAAEAVWAWAKSLWPTPAQWEQVWTGVQVTVGTVGKWLIGASQAIWDFLVSLWPKDWSGIWTSITVTAATVGTWLSAQGAIIIDWLKQFWPADADAWNKIWTSIKIEAATVGQWLQAGANVIVDWLATLWPKDWSKVWKVATLTATEVGAWFAGAAGAVYDWLLDIWRGLDWASIWKTAQMAVEEMTVAVKRLIVNAEKGAVESGKTAEAIRDSLAESLKGVGGEALGSTLADIILAGMRARGTDQSVLQTQLATPWGAAMGLGFKVGEWLYPVTEQMARIAAEIIGALSSRLNEGVGEIAANFFSALGAAIAREWNKPIPGMPSFLRIDIPVQTNPQESDVGTAKRAAGGPLRAGQLALVGEKGPELFVPKTAGAIIPNGAFRTAATGAGTIASGLTPLSADIWERMLSAVEQVTANFEDWRTTFGGTTTALTQAASVATNIARSTSSQGYMPPAWTPAPTTDPRLGSGDRTTIRPSGMQSMVINLGGITIEGNADAAAVGAAARQGIEAALRSYGLGAT